jgi:hypothetical protein
MHGLINQSIQYFIIDTYGPRSWEAVIRLAGIRTVKFEAMLSYDDAMTDKMIEAGVRILGRPRDALLEDLGHYLVSNASVTSVRRLLRFSGVNFVDFVNALEEFPERGHLALPDLDLPELEVLDQGGGLFILKCIAILEGTGHIMVGMLRAMADDYGALVTLEHLGHDALTAWHGGPEGGHHRPEYITIRIADQSLYAARPFHLGMEMV